MKHRYTIYGMQHGSDRESELAQCDSNPQALLDAFNAMTLKISDSIYAGGKKKKVRKYSWLRWEENAHDG